MKNQNVMKENQKQNMKIKRVENGKEEEYIIQFMFTFITFS